MSDIDYSTLQTRTVTLRDYEFEAKPTMSAKDMGRYSMFSNGSVEGDLFKTVSDVIRNTLVPSARQSWDDLWEQDLDVPITFEEVVEFANRLVESDTDRPTQQRSPSGTTASATATPSTGGSDSPAAPASLSSVPARG